MLPPGRASIRTIIKVGAKRAAPSLGRPGRQALGQRARAGGGALPPWSPARWPGSRARASSSSETPFYQPDLPLLWGGMAHAALGQAPALLRVRFVSLPGLRGAGGAAEGTPTPQGTLPCAPAACAPASGVVWAPSSATAAVHSDGLILSRCQGRPGQARAPATCRRPAGRELPVPFPRQEASIHPLRPGEAPTEGI